MDISKKDLLKETGISYGQLYRWKREGLIPEGWFVKKSSITGQETFFPRDLIFSRIEAIQKLKDHYSLEEMAKMLSPEVSNRSFSEEDLEQFSEINIDVAAYFMDLMEKDSFSYYEILIMIVVSNWKRELTLSDDQMRVMIEPMVLSISQIQDVSYAMLLLEIRDAYYMMFLYEKDKAQEHVGYYLDQRIHVKQHIYLTEISNQMKSKYKDIFQFISDEDVQGGNV